MKARDKIDAIHNAKETLKENGFYVDNLWTLHDVQDAYECDDELAYKILNTVLNYEYTIEMINCNIKDLCEFEYKLPKK